MNHMIRTYTALKQVGLVTSARKFSVKYLNRHPCCFAYQKHLGQDWSLLLAMSCLRSIEQQRQCDRDLTPEQVAVLEQLAEEIAAHIQQVSGLRVNCVATLCQ